MAENKQILCPSCGFQNAAPLANNRCVSCGAKIDEIKRHLSRNDEVERRYQQEGFSVPWFCISIGVSAVLTTAIVLGLPMIVPVLDFEGAAGMLVAIPTWFLGGMLVGLISPGKAFIEPVAATFLVAMPTAFLLFRWQTVKTMPAFMYVLMAVLGLLFTLIGSYIGERIQLGPPPKPSD